jgi:hypothetical protein
MHFHYLRRSLLFALLCYFLPVKAQNAYDRLDIASPTAGSLGKSIDFPVNLHTGVPSVSIPIYTVESGRVKVPISLDYHASGIKVMEPASWVGMNWSLNAGGVIIRTVRGAPDRSNTSTVENQNYGHLTNFGFSSYYWNSGVQDWSEFAAGRKDGEPDMFYFKFGNYSGQFYLSDNGKAVLVPDQDIKVRVSDNLNGGELFYFTTPDGIQFRFASGPDFPKDVVNPFTSVSGYEEGTVISSYYLSQIYADSSTLINFNYVPEKYSYYTFSTPAIANSDVTNNNYARLLKNYVNGVRLSSITFDNGRVDFIPGNLRSDLGGFAIKDLYDYANTEAKSLSAIEIKNNNGTYCRRFNLFTSYYYDGTSSLPAMLTNQNIQTDRYRLKLDSIQEASCISGSTLKTPPYRFFYYEGKVPRRLTFAQDHWGYYNGAVFNTTILPTITEKTSNQTINTQGANREPSFPEMRNGSLGGIGYPTGGSTTLLMEGNKALVSDGTPIYNSVYTKSIGFDGSNPIFVEQSVTFAGGSYRIGLSSSYLGSQSGLYVYNPANNQYYVSLTTPSNSSIVDERFIPAGTWKVRLYKDNTNSTGNLTGVGANADISIYAGTTGPADTLVGGLRIYRENRYDAVTDKMEQTDYSYTNGVTPSGVLYSRPVYAQIIRNDLIAQYGDWSPNNGYSPSCSPPGCISCSEFSYLKCGQSIQPLTTAQGAHIGYSEVRVSKPGNGYTIYRFNTGYGYGYSVSSTCERSVDRTACAYSVPNYPASPVPMNFFRGTPKDELYFSEEGRLIKEINYNETYSGNYDSVPAFIATNIGNRLLGTFYNLYTCKKLSNRTVTTDYTADTSNEAMTKELVTYYNGTDHCLPTQTILVNSRGDSLVSKMKYIADFAYQCDAYDTCFANYRSRCNTCQANYSSAQIACSGQGGLCYTNAYLNYQKCMMQSRAIYAYNYDWGHGILGAYFNCVTTDHLYSPDSLLSPIMRMKYDGFKGLLEKSDWKNNKLINAVFNNYKYLPYSDYQRYPQSILKINLLTPSASFSPVVRNGNTITKDVRYTTESSSVFKNNNIVQIQATDGKPAAYIFDYLYRLPVAVVSNAEERDIAFSSFEADGKGNWSFTGIPVNDINSLTGRKNYTLTSNPISKAGLLSTKKYIISYWSKNATSYSVTGTQGVAVKGETRKGWTYFQHIVTGVSSITVSGTGSIDELRLYPIDAQMVTYTYEPLLGITSKCNENDYTEYYQYDNLGKLQTVRDAYGNILKSFDYQYTRIGFNY